MDDADRNDGAVERACEWLAVWLRDTPPPWDGPAEVVVYTRKVVMQLGRGRPITVTAVPGFRFRLRVAPHESPAATLDDQPDDDAANLEIRTVLHVPPSLARRDLEREDEW